MHGTCFQRPRRGEGNAASPCDVQGIGAPGVRRVRARVSPLHLANVIRTPLGRLRAIGLLEGVSFLVLLGIAMPLKYLAGMPEAVRVVGWAHGVLFILFVAAVGEVTLEREWPWQRVLVALVAAVLPFGTLVLDARLRREAAAPRHSAAERAAGLSGSSF